jgi:hypothetical protein
VEHLKLLKVGSYISILKQPEYKMNFNTIIVGLYAVNILIPLILAFVSLICFVWFRGRVENKFTATWLQNLKYSKILDEIVEEEGAFWTFILIDVLIYALVTCILVSLNQHIDQMYLIWVGVLIACIILPRYFFDLCHTLRYNFKTRDS